MTDFKLDNTISASDLIEFDMFPVADTQLVRQEIPLLNLEASEAAINYALRQSRWRAHAYREDDAVRIGYGTTSDVDGLGLTEEQAYSYWIADFKDSERKFKRLVGLDSMPQAAYDALVCLYFLTGSFKQTGSEARRFTIVDYIRNKQWNYVATALVLSNNKKTQRQREAAILMLADYGKQVSRQSLRARGIQEMRSLYPERLLDDRARRQVEYVYYVETSRFLPKLTQSRQRQIVTQTQ